MSRNLCGIPAVLLACLLVFGCSSSSGGNGNPDGSTNDGGDGGPIGGDRPGGGDHDDVCQTNPFDEYCGQECVSSVDCGENLYCGPEGECIADCTPGGDECGPNSICIDHGRCAEECASVDVNLELIMPTVMFLIDQSGSMTSNFGGQERWEAVKQALTHSANAVVPALQGEILFGASLYTSMGGGPDCPILTTVTPALDNSAAIHSLLDDNQPEEDTPTGDSLVALVDLIEALPPEDITPLKIIVLATDGEPDTCEVPNPQEGQEEAIQGAQYAYDHGIRTIILSVGSDVAASHLQDMANAGAGLDVGGPDNEPFYVADNPDELATHFTEIIGGVRSCIFALDGEVQPIEYAAYGVVKLNGQELPFDDPDGWRLADASTLELLGDACELYKSQEDAELTAQFPCGAIWVP
jgi:hypothetical protein